MLRVKTLFFFFKHNYVIVYFIFSVVEGGYHSLMESFKNYLSYYGGPSKMATSLFVFNILTPVNYNYFISLNGISSRTQASVLVDLLSYDTKDSDIYHDFKVFMKRRGPLQSLHLQFKRMG